MPVAPVATGSFFIDAAYAITTIAAPGVNPQCGWSARQQPRFDQCPVDDGTMLLHPPRRTDGLPL